MTRYRVTVRPAAKRSGIAAGLDGVLVVAVKALPRDGMANREVIRTLAGFFGVPPARIRIVAGARVRRKIVEVAD